MLKSLRAPGARSLPRVPCAAAQSQTRWASSDKGPNKTNPSTFKSQMVQSITQRIARERQELMQAAALREARGIGRNFATTMGE